MSARNPISHEHEFVLAIYVNQTCADNYMTFGLIALDAIAGIKWLALTIRKRAAMILTPHDRSTIRTLSKGRVYYIFKPTSNDLDLGPNVTQIIWPLSREGHRMADQGSPKCTLRHIPNVCR